jgi:adenine/guanine phosphoribosyltransferase-like PRPP-binding protein
MNPNISYIEYARVRNLVIDKIPRNKYDYVISFTNGGNVFSSDVAQALNVPILFHDPKKHRCTPLPEGTALVVDDIYDTGKTWEGFLGNFGYGFDLCVLYTTRDNATRYYGELIKPDHPWLHFPWEF